MRVLVDATYITRETWYKSLSVYLFRFLDSIKKDSYKDFVILVLPEVMEDMLLKYPGMKQIVYNPYSEKLSGNRFLKYIRRRRLYRDVVNSSDCDALFVPNDLIMFSAIKTRLKKTVVIHDMKSINEKSKLSLSYWIFWLYYWLLIKYAAHVVAISTYTKQDIIRFFKKAQDKIKVVYNSVTIPTAGNMDLKINGPYLLYVNALLSYKNLITLVKAYSLLKSQIQHKLVVVGKETEYWLREVLPWIKREGIEDRVIRLQDISEEYLATLYRNASLFITTSLKEGFGYTPIEAAMCGCPVISTKCEALGDTTRDLLYYYNPPTDETDLSEQILNVLQNPPPQEHLKSISEEYKKIYNTENQTKLLLEIVLS